MSQHLHLKFNAEYKPHKFTLMNAPPQRLQHSICC
jgi:hypothetical protein